jgi:hypothetical protein
MTSELRQQLLKSLRRQSKGELIEMIGRGLGVQDELWATQAALARSEQRVVEAEKERDDAILLRERREVEAREMSVKWRALVRDHREAEARAEAMHTMLSRFDLTDEDGNVCDEDGDPYPDDYHCPLGAMRVDGIKEIHALLCATPPRAGEEGPPATENTLHMIRDEANLAGLFLANDDGDLAAQHVGNIVRIVGDALGGVPATTTTNAGLREALAALWAWVEPKVDWACLRYQPHPDPKKATHYAYDPKNKAVWDLRAQVEAALAAAPPARRVDEAGAK